MIFIMKVDHQDEMLWQGFVPGFDGLHSLLWVKGMNTPYLFLYFGWADTHKAPALSPTNAPHQYSFNPDGTVPGGTTFELTPPRLFHGLATVCAIFR